MRASRPSSVSVRALARDRAGAPDWSLSPERRKLNPTEVRAGASASGRARAPVNEVAHPGNNGTGR